MSMIQYRRATEKDYNSSVDFANLVFSMAYRPHDFKRLSPKVYQNAAFFAAAPHYLAIDDQLGIRGMVGVYPNILNIGPAPLKTGFVGTVSVHPYARGEGHMKKLMAMALEDLRANGTDLAILGGQRQRYEYFGFIQGGLQRNWRVTQTNLRHLLGGESGSDLALTEATPDPELMARCATLNDNRPLAARRSAKDFFVIAQTCQSRLYIVTLNGAFAGYYILEGQRLNEIQLTDWTLLPWVLRLLMRTHMLDAVEIVAGEPEMELNRQLCRFADRTSLTHYDMVQIFNFPKVIGALMALKATYAPLADGCFSCWIDNAPLTLEITNGTLTVTQTASADAPRLTSMQAQTLFLNPNGQMATDLSLPLGWAPLPLFMSPADSF